MTFGWTDPGGVVLTAGPSSTIGGACRIELEDPEGGTRLCGDAVRICAIVPQLQVRDKAAGIAAAMHQAAALPEPLILSRPGPAPELLTEVARGVDVGISHSPEQPVLLAVRGVSALFTPGTARLVAAHLAARAGQAEAEPEAVSLREIASLISTLGSAEQGQRAARAILARFELRERAL